MIGRRNFITLLGGAAAWPLAVRAQQPVAMRRIGVLIGVADDTEGQARLEAFRRGLQALGWTEGRNVHIVARFAPSNSERQTYAAELVRLTPDVILANTTVVVQAHSGRRKPFQSCSRNSPIQLPLGAWSRTSHARAATSPASPASNARWVENGSICSRRLRLACHGPWSSEATPVALPCFLRFPHI